MTRTNEFKSQGLYSNLYQGMPGAEAPKSGGSVADQARAAGYTDMYRNIQAMRNDDYKRELSRGEITKEFSGMGESSLRESSLRGESLYKHLRPRLTPVRHRRLPYTMTHPERVSGLGGFFGEAAKKTGPGLMLALGAVIVYFLFIKKPANDVAEEVEAEEEVADEVVASSRFRY